MNQLSPNLVMMNICFLGDISFNDKGKTEQLNVTDFLECKANNEFTIANLEALASVGEKNLLKKPRVTTSIEALDKLGKLDIKLVSLAHNHVYDAKLSGFKATLKKLDELGISYIGAGLTYEQASKPYILEDNNLKIGFLNYCTYDTNPSLPEECEVYLNMYDKNQIKRDILKLNKTCDKVVLLLHWGGTLEGGYYPDTYQLEDAKVFSKLGVDLIVGHHPHTLQPSIVLDSTPVFFSLGNFIFYDIKHDNKNISLSPRRKNGGILKVVFTKNKDLVHKLYSSKQTKEKLIIRPLRCNAKIRNFIYRSSKNSKLFYLVYKIKFKYINPLIFFIIYQEGGINKYKKLNLNKLKRFLWKK